MGSYKTKEDDVARISTSIYVTNFPESLSAKELFQSCKVYGHVVDSFIPTKRAKNSKRFGFVRFINVFNVERLVRNLCTVWNDRHKLHANIARFQRDVASGSNAGVKMAGGFRDKKTNVFSSEKENVKATKVNGGGGNSYVTHDLDSYIMGELKQFSSINNVRVLLANEGFNILNVAYLGGLWVMIEMDSANTKSKLLQHVGVASWFNQLCNAQCDFVSRERVVWVDIEGVPLHVWSCNTFKKIGSKWGEMLDLEESKDALFARKHICIRTKQEDNILEKFKIIIRGKVFVAGGKAANNANSDDESDVEGISDTVFGDQDDNTANAHVHEQIGQNAEGSYDPFNIYDLLRNKDDGVTPFEVNTSFTHPPGFTPEKDKNNSNEKEQIQKDTECSQNRSEGLSSRILVDEQQDDQPTMENNNIGLVNNKKGGSILEVLDDMIKIGQVMGYSMDGCLRSKAKKTWIRELCVKHKAISDKRMLWNYISLLLSRWVGECVVMEDFNEVRTESERFSSVFNAQGASAFNDFISNSGLFDVLLEGGCTDDILLTRKDLMKQLHELKESDARDSIQKAKVQWAIEGDENSNFFHGVINRKRANLAIRGVMVDGKWVDDPSRIKEAFRIHFATCFKSPNVNRSRLAFEFPKTLNPEQVFELESPISKDEIRKAVWACGTNSSFIALIPKSHEPKLVTDYWPICLIGSLYKVVTKILATRLSLVISELISDVQTAFVAGRQILDGPFIINDLLSWCKHNNKQTIVFKVDFAKAYDSVRWDYLDDVLRSFGFGSKWCSWIKDDDVFIGEWSQDNLNRILNVLHCFHLAYGLRLNVKKSHLLGVGVPHVTIHLVAVNLGCSVMKAPFKYLGVMIEGNTLKTGFWGNIIHKLNSRMSKWKLKTLSIGGRLTLLKSVLGAIPIYNMSLLKVPKTVLNLMESIRIDFFYGFHGEAKKLSGLSGPKFLLRRNSHSARFSSIWSTIIREVYALKNQGDNQLRVMFPRIYALELHKDCTVADKMVHTVVHTLHRWRWDMNGSGEFHVKDVRNLLDDFFLPKDDSATRWIKSVPIKLNVFAWRASQVSLYKNTFRMSFLPARWLLLLLALFVDGGTWIGSPSLRIWIGCRGSRTFGWDPKSRACWKVFSILLCGLYGILEIKIFLRLKNLGRKSFSTILLLVLFLGFLLDVRVLLVGPVGVSTLL
nr:RNA-directed DNA polymerase, eukaryota [Tanacetum cinerariifolium]